MKHINMAVSICRLCPFRDYFVQSGSFCDITEEKKDIKDIETIPDWCPLPDLLTENTPTN